LRAKISAIAGFSRGSSCEFIPLSKPNPGAKKRGVGRAKTAYGLYAPFRKAESEAIAYGKYFGDVKGVFSQTPPLAFASSLRA
jgi:hypothetical protein